MKRKILERIGMVVDYLEDQKVSLIQLFLMFFFFISLRYFLDMYVRAWTFNTEGFLGHITAAFSQMLFFILVTHFGTGEKVEKSARVIIPIFFLIGISTTIIDLLVYGRGGFSHVYLRDPVDLDLLIKFFTFFGPLEEYLGVSIGTRMFVFVLAASVFIYIFYKTRKAIKSAFFAFVTYAILFLGLSTYILLRTSQEITGLHDGFIFVGFTHLIKYFLIWIIILLGITFYRTKKDHFLQLLKDINPYYLAHFLLMFIIGIFLGNSRDPIMMDQNLLFRLILAIITITLAWTFSSSASKLFDNSFNNEDSKSKSSIPKKSYVVIATILLIITVLYSISVGMITMFVVILFIGSNSLYKVPPFRLEKIPVISKLPYAFSSLLLLMLGHSFTGDFMDIPDIVIILFLTIIVLGMNVLDIKKIERDIKTLPTLMGLKRAKLYIGGYFALAVFSFYFIIREFVKLEGTFRYILMGFLLTVGVIEFYLINRKNYREKTVLIVYLVLLVILIFVIYLL